jgi:HAD superfamily hydrolase (TIGR01509 family)
MAATRAIILDMDGTITQPVIDWKKLRAEIGSPQDRTIMQHIRSLSGDERERAESILLKTEMEGTRNVPLNQGFFQLHAEIRARGLRTALVTNNHGAAMRNVLATHDLSFDIALSRDDGELKPAPDMITLALEHLKCGADEALGVGDSHLDIAACGAAGVTCIYLTHGSPQFNHTPSAPDLSAVIPML